MFRAFRYSFILAKIYGMTARTYVGSAFQDLLRLKRLEEIYDVLFPGKRGSAPEESLSAELEARIVEAGIRSVMDVMAMLDDPPEVLVHLLRRYEYQNVKSIVRSLVNAGTEKPILRDLGKYARVRYEGAGDPEKALSAGPYAWVLPHLRSAPLVEIENMLDRDYFARLLALAKRLSPPDRRGVLRLVSLEIALTNAVWALRLRFFFGMDARAAVPLMIPGTVDAQRKAIAEAFEIPPDSAEGWRRWKYAWMVEDQLGEAFRAPDPVRAEQKSARRLALRAHQLLHEDPFTLTPIAAFFKLKELETGMLKIAVEARRLSVPERDVLSLVGAG